MASVAPPRLEIDPPLVNSSNPWATSLEDLRKLYECSSTGAVTTRTSLIRGFAHDPGVHQYTLFNLATNESSTEPVTEPVSGEGPLGRNASLNSLGYSPITLKEYLQFIKQIAKDHGRPSKGFLVSVTGDPEEVASSYGLIVETQREIQIPLAMEINLSCPNIPGKPPPAYSGEELARYLVRLHDAVTDPANLPRIPFGLKTPPYTYSSQFKELINALVKTADEVGGTVSDVSFITATNTLGSCVVFGQDTGEPGVKPSSAASFDTVLPGSGIGGLAGAPLHPLALGNVMTLRKLMDEQKGILGHIQIVGIGGVLDAGGFRRMKTAGAAVVGVGTGLGLKGVGIFKEIEAQLEGNW